ncbi:MAG: hypothetical protein AAF657_21765 [Acidobacteriota bacterium]
MTFLATQMVFCLLVAFLLGLLLGWLLTRGRCQERIVLLEVKWRRRLDAGRAERERLRSELEARSAPASSAPGAPAADDLKRIEGIGPKIERLLHARGLTTWQQLAEAEVAFLQSILDDAGPRFRIHDPAPWPEQASLAAKGAWDELDELRGRPKGGRET